MMERISDRQAEILEAAAKLLTTGGVSGLTIKNLAKEMQFSESAIYRHFSSKEEIILTMLDYVLTGVTLETVASVAASASAVDTVKAFFRSQFAFFQQRPYLTVVIFSDGLLEESTRINEKILSIMNSRKVILEPMVLRAQEAGEITREVSAEEIVHILMGSVRLLMYRWRVGQFGFDVRQIGESLLTSIFKLIVIPA